MSRLDSALAPASVPSFTANASLLFLRVAASVLLLVVHGLPKATHYSSQLAAIEDPLHLGKTLTLGFAIFAEVLCPVLMIAGFATRLGALPIMVITLMALTPAHPERTLDQAQFAWMLLILFGTIVIGGARRYHASWFTRTLASRRA